MFTRQLSPNEQSLGSHKPSASQAPKEPRKTKSNLAGGWSYKQLEVRICWESTQQVECYLLLSRVHSFGEDIPLSIGLLVDPPWQSLLELHSLNCFHTISFPLFEFLKNSSLGVSCLDLCFYDHYLLLFPCNTYCSTQVSHLLIHHGLHRAFESRKDQGNGELGIFYIAYVFSISESEKRCATFRSFLPIS